MCYLVNPINFVKIMVQDFFAIWTKNR